MSNRIVEMIINAYPAGTRIMLDDMGDDPNPVASGEKGTVVVVDDAGTVHVNFDCGRQLGLIRGVDTFHTISE